MKGEHQLQLGFSDHLLKSKVSDDDFLIRMDRLIDWSVFEQALSACYSDQGRPSVPPLILFKMLLLQQWFGLSDPGVEAQCKDRLSYHRFLGLSLDETIPDETTLVRFRKRLRTHKGVYSRLFELMTDQLSNHDVVIKQGTLIDASIIPSARQSPNKWRDKDSSDKEAKWTTKNGKSTYGYKVHIGTDLGTDIVRSIAVTPANVHDSKICDDLIVGDEQAVFADKAYANKARAKRLKAQGTKNGILRRASRNRPLTVQEKQFNRFMGIFRNNVERVFGDWKQHRNLRRLRYLGLERNWNHLQMMALAHNMRCLLRTATG